MLRHIEKLGLRRSLYLIFAVVMLGVVAVSGVAIDWAVRSALERGVRREGENEVEAIAEHAAEALRDERSAAGPALLRHLQGHMATAVGREDAFIALLRADRSVAVKVAQPEWDARVAELAPRVVEQAADGMVAREGLYLLAQPVRAPGGAGAPLGWVVHGQPAARLGEEVSEVRTLLLFILGVGGALLLSGLYLVTSRLLITPIVEMSAVAVRVSEADLSARAGHKAEDELGALAISLNRIAQSLGETVSRIRGVSEGVAQIIERVRRTGDVVSRGAGTVAARVADTGTAAGEMLHRLKGIADNVEVLAQGAEESSASILQMAATNDAVAEHTGVLAKAVEETTAAILAMTVSVKDVARNVEDLAATAEETSASMSEINVSIGQVESNANETARLSEQASRDAELGAEAISRTLAGIDKIKLSAREAAQAIDQLGRRIGAVGNILDVIDDVAEQTNLLALNAAILAAQSGEHGKGFAVVADEIKDLAERTGASTKEIAAVIRSVQDQSKDAVAAMEKGVQSVEEGVRLGLEAESALKKIQASSQKSTKMVKAIARSTVDQAFGSKAVTMAISRIAERASQIAAATAGQAHGSEQIMKSAEKMQGITKEVERSSLEQARGSKQITRSIESISDMVNHLNRAQREQTRGAEAVLGAVQEIAAVAEAQAASAAELEGAIRDLAEQAEVLRGEVRRFRT